MMFRLRLDGLEKVYGGHRDAKRMPQTTQLWAGSVFTKDPVVSNYTW